MACKKNQPGSPCCGGAGCFSCTDEVGGVILETTGAASGDCACDLSATYLFDPTPTTLDQPPLDVNCEYDWTDSDTCCDLVDSGTRTRDTVVFFGGANPCCAAGSYVRTIIKCGWRVYHQVTHNWTLTVKFISPLTVRFTLALTTVAEILLDRCTDTHVYCGPSATGPWTLNAMSCGSYTISPADPVNVVDCDLGATGCDEATEVLSSATWNRTWTGETTLADCTEIESSVTMTNADGAARSISGSFSTLCLGAAIPPTTLTEPCVFTTVSARLFTASNPMTDESAMEGIFSEVLMDNNDGLTEILATEGL